MIDKEMIKKKLGVFHNLKAKVHITLSPTSRYPKGKFQNGFIVSFEDAGDDFEFIRFQDDKQGLVRLFLDDIEDVEDYTKPNE